MAQCLGCRISDQRDLVRTLNFRSVLEQVTFTPCLVLIKARKWWTDLDEAGVYFVPNVCSPRDLLARPDNMAENVPHTHKYMIEKPFKYLYLQNHCTALMKLVMYHLGLLLIIVCSNVDLG